jgi:flagellar motor switch protein FliN/FliY
MTFEEEKKIMANPKSGAHAALGLLRDVEVEVTLEIGRKRMKIGDLLRLGTGQTLELDKAAGEPLEIMVNGRLIGRGEAVVLGDRYGLRITEIVAAAGGESESEPTSAAAPAERDPSNPEHS